MGPQDAERCCFLGLIVLSIPNEITFAKIEACINCSLELDPLQELISFRATLPEFTYHNQESKYNQSNPSSSESFYSDWQLQISADKCDVIHLGYNNVRIHYQICA